VDDPLLVGLLERLGDLPGEVERLGRRDRPPGDALGQVLAPHVLEHEEAAAVHLLEAEDGPDVRVVEGGEELGLALEAPEALGVLRDLRGEELDRHRAAELRVLGPEDLAHAAGADLHRRRS
jgi:hypothetical protein